MDKGKVSCPKCRRKYQIVLPTCPYCSTKNPLYGVNAITVESKTGPRSPIEGEYKEIKDYKGQKDNVVNQKTSVARQSSSPTVQNKAAAPVANRPTNNNVGAQAMQKKPVSAPTHNQQKPQAVKAAEPKTTEAAGPSANKGNEIANPQIKKQSVDVQGSHKEQTPVKRDASEKPQNAQKDVTVAHTKAPVKIPLPTEQKQVATPHKTDDVIKKESKMETVIKSDPAPQNTENEAADAVNVVEEVAVEESAEIVTDENTSDNNNLSSHEVEENSPEDDDNVNGDETEDTEDVEQEDGDESETNPMFDDNELDHETKRAYIDWGDENNNDIDISKAYDEDGKYNPNHDHYYDDTKAAISNELAELLAEKEKALLKIALGVAVVAGSIIWLVVTL